MPGIEGMSKLEAQPFAPKANVETTDVLAEGIGEDTENKAMNLLSQIEG